MATKLKSIVRQTPWFLVAKAALVGLASWVFPFWFFFFVALYFYLVPAFNAVGFFLPFLLGIALFVLLPHGFPSAFAIGLIFFLVLGIKDLIFIARERAYETLLFFLLFLLYAVFFSRVEIAGGSPPVLRALLVSALVFFLLRGFVLYGGPGLPELKKNVGLALLAFLVWQLLIALLFMPISPWSQTALLFLATVAGLELLVDDLHRRLTSRTVLGYAALVTALLLVILGTNQWQP